MTSRTLLLSKQQQIYAMRIWPLSTGNLHNLNSIITNKANLTNPTVHLTQTPQYTIQSRMYTFLFWMVYDEYVGNNKHE